MGQGQGPFDVVQYQGLGVLRGGGAGGGVADVADAQISGEAGEERVVEDLAHQPQALVKMDVLRGAFGGGDGDAAGLLSPVLQGAQSPEDGSGHAAAGRVQNAEDAALLPESGSVSGGDGGGAAVGIQAACW